MYTQALLLSVLAAIAEARFGQEQIPIQAISDLSAFGNAGEAATLAGQSISFLLGAANPCGKLSQADLIVQTLGTDPEVIAAARGLVAAEQNFNPFAVSIPAICSDATLPATEELRGVVPLVDPAVTGSDVENANSATSLDTPFDATGLSVAEVMAAQGFSNFSTTAADGTAGAAPAAGADTGADDGADAETGDAEEVVDEAPAADEPAAVETAVASACPPATTFVTVTAGAAVATETAVADENAGDAEVDAGADDAEADAGADAGAGADTGAGAVQDDVTGNFDGFEASSLGLDFGTCTPTIKFEAGLNGRSEDEFTFQAIDPVVNQGQQEALNPNIITNRICDQLGNVCGAGADGVAACEAAQADIEALGTRDQTTADAWNEALGFAGANTNPDDAPKAGLVGHT